MSERRGHDSGVNPETQKLEKIEGMIASYPTTEGLLEHAQEIARFREAHVDKQEITDNEDILEDELIDFVNDETTHFSTEERNDIIGYIIDQTSTEKGAEADARQDQIPKLHELLKAMEREKTLPIPRVAGELDIDDAEVVDGEIVDDSPTTPIPSPSSPHSSGRSGHHGVGSSSSGTAGLPPPPSPGAHLPSRKDFENYRRQQQEIEEEINAADRIYGRYRRAKALSAIALQYSDFISMNSSEGESLGVAAARRIRKSPLRWRNPLRFPGSDTSEHDRVLEEIAKKRNKGSVEAAQKIIRGNARNRTQKDLGNFLASRGDRDIASELAGEMSGARKGKWGKELTKEIVLGIHNADEAIRFIKSEVDGFRKRDPLFKALAIKHKKLSITQEIKNPFLRSSARRGVLAAKHKK